MQIYLYDKDGELLSMNNFSNDINYYLDNNKMEVYLNLEDCFYNILNRMKLHKIVSLDDIKEGTKILLVKKY